MKGDSRKNSYEINKRIASRSGNSVDAINLNSRAKDNSERKNRIDRFGSRPSGLEMMMKGKKDVDI